MCVRNLVWIRRYLFLFCAFFAWIQATSGKSWTFAWIQATFAWICLNSGKKWQLLPEFRQLVRFFCLYFFVFLPEFRTLSGNFAWSCLNSGKSCLNSGYYSGSQLQRYPIHGILSGISLFRDIPAFVWDILYLGYPIGYPCVGIFQVVVWDILLHFPWNIILDVPMFKYHVEDIPCNIAHFRNIPSFWWDICVFYLHVRCENYVSEWDIPVHLKGSQYLSQDITWDIPCSFGLILHCFGGNFSLQRCLKISFYISSGSYIYK